MIIFVDWRELDKNCLLMGGVYILWKNIKWNMWLGSFIFGFWDSKFYFFREKNNKIYSFFRICGFYFIVLSVYLILKWILNYLFGSKMVVWL